MDNLPIACQSCAPFGGAWARVFSDSAGSGPEIAARGFLATPGRGVFGPSDLIRSPSKRVDITSTYRHVARKPRVLGYSESATFRLWRGPVIATRGGQAERLGLWHRARASDRHQGRPGGAAGPLASGAGR